MAASKRSIIVVDDEPDVRTYLSLVLKQYGFEVRTASTAPEGLALLRERRPALACIDIMMPKESGISLYKQMRRDPALADVPVLFVSGAARAGEFDFFEFAEDASLPQPEGYIEKPIVVDEFIATVSKLIGYREDNHAAK